MKTTMIKLSQQVSDKVQASLEFKVNVSNITRELGSDGKRYVISLKCDDDGNVEVSEKFSVNTISKHTNIVKAMQENETINSSISRALLGKFASCPAGIIRSDNRLRVTGWCTVQIVPSRDYPGEHSLWRIIPDVEPKSARRPRTFGTFGA